MQSEHWKPLQTLTTMSNTDFLRRGKCNFLNQHYGQINPKATTVSFQSVFEEMFNRIDYNRLEERTTKEVLLTE